MKTKHPNSILLLLSFLLFFSFSTEQVSATTWLGSDISYERTDSFKYMVSVTLYRDCRYVPFTAPVLSLNCGTNSDTLLTSLKSIKDISLSCDTFSVNPCNPANSFGGNGMEEQVYQVEVDLNSTRLKKFKTCGQLYFSVTNCCRSSTITTGAASRPHYNYAMVNPVLAEHNNSPKFVISPKRIFTMNSANYMSFGVIDNDGDSVSYELAEPLFAHNRPIKLNSPFTYKKPFNHYDPSGTGYTNPNVNPPLGTHLDARSGQLSFTPTKNNEVSPVVVMVKEYRLDSGVYKHIGTTRRDMRYAVEHNGNNMPFLSYRTPVYNCDSKSFDLSIMSSDRPFVIPGKPAPPKDTTRILWWSGLNALTGTSIPQKQLDSVQLSWSGKNNDDPFERKYIFVQVLDNHCATNATNSYSIGFDFKDTFPGGTLKRSADIQKCGKLVFTMEFNTTLASSVIPTIVPRDSSGQRIPLSSAAVVQALGQKQTSKNTYEAEFQFLAKGQYIIETKWTGSRYCPTSTFDTIQIDTAAPQIGLISRMEICCDAGILSLDDYVATKGGNWRVSQDTSLITNRDQFNSAKACNPQHRTSYYATYKVRDKGTSCESSDSFQITLNPLPRLQLVDGNFCQDRGKVTLDELIWLPARLTGPFREVSCIDCGSYDFKDILDTTGPTFDQQFSFNISPSGMNLGSKVQDSITIVLDYGDANGCRVRDTATITVTRTPEIKFLEIPDMCWDEGLVDLKARTAASPTDGFWYCYDTTVAIPGFRYCSDSLMEGALTNDLFGGDTLNTIKTNPAGGTYYMRYKHIRSGCPTFRDTFMTINPLPKPKINWTIFAGKGLGREVNTYYFLPTNKDFFVGAAPNGGVWGTDFPGVLTGNTFKPSEAPVGTPFFVRYFYTDANGCSDWDSIRVQVTQGPVVNRNGDVLSSTLGPNYQWFRNGLLMSTANSQELVVKQTGKYVVRHRYPNIDLFSDTLTVDQLGINIPGEMESFTVYPNPAKKSVQILFAKPVIGSICLRSSTGQCVHRTQINASTITIPLKEYARGVYWLEFSGASGIKSTRKLVLE